MKRLTLAGRLIITLLIVGAVYGAFKLFGGKSSFLDKIIPNKTQSSSQPLDENEAQQATKVAVVTWGGYAGGQYFNEGFAANKNSRFYKDYNQLVEFKVLDDFVQSREAFKAGKVDLLWTTIDAFPTEVKGLADEGHDPVVVFQADWSRGGDAIVVRRGINSVSDLKVKAGSPKMKIAVAPMTPSHSFLLNLFKAGEIKSTDVQIVEVANAIDAADIFKKGQVDAAVVWSPDDEDCIQKVAGSKVLLNTKTATNIIADVFIAKRAWVEKNPDKVKNLVEGWLKGAAEINNSDEAKKKAAKILADGLSQPEDFCYKAINNAHLCTYGDNVNFFNLNGTYKGVSGEELYNRMSVEYQNAGYVKPNKAGSPDVPTFRAIAYPNTIKSITSLTGPENEGESVVRFEAASESQKNADAISSKKVSISFASGSYVLDENAKYIIDREFVDIAKSFSTARIRIEGNTDDVGNPDSNRELSRKRAEAVANYLTNSHNFDRNRFVVVGNGSDKPVAENSTDSGKARNRRTDFELLPQ